MTEARAPWRLGEGEMTKERSLRERNDRGPLGARKGPRALQPVRIIRFYEVEVARFGIYNGGGRYGTEKRDPPRWVRFPGLGSKVAR
jgi:hypothetical protein